MKDFLNDPDVIKMVSSKIDDLLKQELIEKFPTTEGLIVLYKDDDTDGTEYSMLNDSLGVSLYKHPAPKGKFDFQFRVLWLDVAKFIDLANTLWKVTSTDILQNFENVRSYFFKILESVNLYQAISVELLNHLKLPVNGRLSDIYWNGDAPEWYFSNNLDFQYMIDAMDKAPAESLIRYINHVDPRIRRECCKRIPFEYVHKLKKDTDPRVRVAVVCRLKGEQLSEHTKDPHFIVRREVAKRVPSRYLHDMKKDDDVQIRLSAYHRLVILGKI